MAPGAGTACALPAIAATIATAGTTMMSTLVEPSLPLQIPWSGPMRRGARRARSCYAIVLSRRVMLTIPTPITPNKIAPGAGTVGVRRNRLLSPLYVPRPTIWP